MNRRHRQRLSPAMLALALAWVMALVLAAGSPVLAQQERERLETLRPRGLTEIDRRLATLTEATSRVNGAERITAEHKTQLIDQLKAQQAGLSALRTKVTGDRRLATLRADLAKVVNDYRVYVLTVPRTRGVAAADIVLAALDRMGELSERLGAAVDSAEIEGAEDEDVKETAVANLESLRAKVGQTRVKIESLAATLLALQPASYPANRPTLEAARSDLRDARAALKGAVSLARQIATALKG